MVKSRIKSVFKSIIKSIIKSQIKSRIKSGFKSAIKSGIKSIINPYKIELDIYIAMSYYNLVLTRKEDKMKTFKNIAAQGDFLIIRVNKIPKNVEPYEASGNHYIVAHSETGHNHVMERTHVEAFKPKDVKEVDLYDLFLVVKEPTSIEHLRGHDTHETIVVPPGSYHVRRQREYTPEGFRKAAD